MRYYPNIEPAAPIGFDLYANWLVADHRGFVTIFAEDPDYPNNDHVQHINKVDNTGVYHQADMGVDCGPCGLYLCWLAAGFFVAARPFDSRLWLRRDARGPAAVERTGRPPLRRHRSTSVLDMPATCAAAAAGEKT